MKTIFKYTLSPDSYLQVPRGSIPLFVANQKEVAHIWFIVDPSEIKEMRRIHIYGTGQEIPDDPGIYLGSFLMSGGSLVFHAFEEMPED
jgi:hypothetical protein